jgi:hypothetical protein
MAGRHFDKISKAHLWHKLMDQFGEDDRYGGKEERYLDVRGMHDALRKDLKVSFDLENWEYKEKTDEGHLIGLHTLGNNLTFLGLYCGGDWEVPVFWIVYWDGSKIRAYVPTDGNPYNTDTKEAYGNDDDKDIKNARKRWPGVYDDITYADQIDGDFEWDKIKKDIETRLTLKEGVRRGR